MSSSVVVANTALANCNSLIPAAIPAARTTRAATSVVPSTSTRLAATYAARIRAEAATISVIANARC